MSPPNWREYAAFAPQGGIPVTLNIPEPDLHKLIHCAICTLNLHGLNRRKWPGQTKANSSIMPHISSASNAIPISIHNRVPWAKNSQMTFRRNIPIQMPTAGMAASLIPSESKLPQLIHEPMTRMRNMSTLIARQTTIQVYHADGVVLAKAVKILINCSSRL